MAFASSLVAPLLPPPRPPSGAAWGRRARATPPRLVLAASSRGGDPAPLTFERLREQLFQLHAEADLTQSKANSARVRLVRLTEAAENLKKRAVVSVQLGRENEAVDLLVQKKKLTNALENIKERIEVLDKLSAKISEAISMKQNMLIEHALRPGMPNGEESSDEIRVFSGKVDDGAGEASGSLSKSGERGSFEMKNVVYSNMASYPEQSELQLADSYTLSKDHDPTNSRNNRSAYGDFIEHIDSQLNSLEYEIEQFVSSQLAQEVDIQQQRNGKWHKLTDILKLLTETRKRIAEILDNTEVKNAPAGKLVWILYWCFHLWLVDDWKYWSLVYHYCSDERKLRTCLGHHRIFFYLAWKSTCGRGGLKAAEALPWKTYLSLDSSACSSQDSVLQLG